jgi:hypothetical protein
MSYYATGRQGLGTGAKIGLGFGLLFTVLAVILQLVQPKPTVTNPTAKESGAMKGVRITSYVLSTLCCLYGLLSLMGIFGRARGASLY